MGRKTRPRGPTGEARRLAGRLKLVSPLVRVGILFLLAERERPAGGLAAELRLSQSAVGRHLAQLRAGGLVATRREGRGFIYALTDEGRALVRVVEAMGG